jgi:hypothetical protein
MSRTIKKGATSQSLYFDVFDSTSSTGGRKTGLAYNTSSLIAYYCRNGGSATAITLATLAAANSSWSSGGFKEVDATNMPGLYRLDVPDAAFASGAESVVVAIAGATGMVLSAENVQLIDNTATDVYSRIGAPAGASVSADIATVAGYVDTEVAAIKAKTDQLTFTVSNQVDVNVVDWKGSAAPAMTGDAYARIGANGAGLTAIGDTRIAHLDADVSTRSTYAGADTSGTTTLLGRLTSTRAGLLDHLDADISSRMATFSYTAPDNAGITAIKTKTDNLPSDPADQSLIIAATDSLSGQISGLNNLSQADIRNAVGLASANLDSQIASLATAAGLSDLSDGISASFTALQSHGDGAWSTATGFSTLDASDVSAAVWDVAMADHLGAGTTGDAIFQAGVHAPSADSKADTIIADIAALNNLSAADVNAEVDTAIADAALATAANLAATDDKVDAVKTKTDSLAFTGGAVDANIEKVNGVTVQGAGTTGNEWRPA